MKNTVIFDLDGTLACTAGDLLAGINHMLKTVFGFPPLSMEEMMTGVNFCERDYVKHLVQMSIKKSGRNDIDVTEQLIDECVEAGWKSGRFILCPSAGYMEYIRPTEQYIENLLFYLNYGYEAVERCRKD